ncbi:VWA domain-containing protein [Proteobacteria bacterium 005FR1]|nr:VWA domain-containing protein [Proteobacteria bacterium 005FR1]
MLLAACSGEQVNYKRGVYLLLDTSGTYTEELNKAQQIINFLLANLEAGDTFVVARIDSGSFSEKDIVAKVVLDSRPSAANRQKREFAAAIDQFVVSVQSSAYTDISGGLLQAVEYLNEADVGQKSIFIFSDMKEELPEGYVRDFSLALDGYQVKALNVTKLRSDNVNPQEYLARMTDWQTTIEQGGGRWAVVNDLDRPEALAF